MNIKQYIKENPTADLAMVNAHSLVTGKMISPDMMLAFLTAFDLIDVLDTVAENPNTAVTKEAKALRKAFSFGSEFNLIMAHPANVITLFNNLVADEIFSQPFAVYCIEYANKETFPFANATQEELDAVKADIALYAPTLPTAIGHPHIDSAIGYTVTTSNKSVQVAAILTAPAPVDMTIEVFFHTDYSDTQVFDTVGMKVGFIRIKQGETNGSINVSKSLSRKIQASAVSDVVCDYNLIIKG